MALNTKSKAYQGLLDKGYTAEQIQQMADNVASGMTTSQAIASVKQANTTQPASNVSTKNDRPRDQGDGNYVYNPSTGYYEKEGTARASLSYKPETTKQETPVKQQETVGSTVSEVKQEGALKPKSQDYYNQTGDDAQNKIRYNLNQYRQSNPGLFSTYEDFKKNFSYNARNDEQKQTLDAWYGEYQKGMEYGAIPTADLYTQYKDGSISTSDLEILRTYNPEKYAELQAQINKGNIIQAYDDTAPSDKQDFQDLAYQYASGLFKRFMNGDGGSEANKFFDEYRANMDSPEMMELQDKTTDLVEQGKNIQDQIFSIQKDVEKEYEGTGATRSKINAIIADRTYDLQQQLRTINNEYEKYATQYNNRATQYQNEFQLQLQEYQVNMEARNQQMKELGFAMDLMNFETNEQKQQREWDYWVKQQEYANGDINSSNPTIQLKGIQNSVDELLANYAGIPTQRSNVQIAQDIQTAIKNGSNIGAELTKLNQQMQSKPEYKLMYNATYNGKQTLGTINGKSAVISYDAAGNYIGYELLNTTPNSISNSNRSSQIKSFSDVWDISSNSWDNYVANLENAVKLGSWGGQCGAGANDILTGAGANKIFGNSLSDKIKICDNKFGANASNDYSQLKKGDFVVLDTGAKLQDGTPAGHVGVIKGIDLKNGTITVFDTNGQAGKECRGESTYKLDIVRGTYDPRIHGNFREVEATEQPTSERWNAMNSASSNPGYSTEDIGVYEKYLKGTAPGQKYIDDKGGWDVFKAEVRAYQADKGNSELESQLSTITDSDIISFNDKTLNRKLSDEDRQRIADARNKVYSDPDASIEDILRFSQGGDSVTDATVQSFDKYGQALTSLGQLTDLLEDTSTGPILGALRSKNPYDKKAREIETAIAGLLPTLARGVYGEVGVLTDKDIEHYSKTVPNLKSTNDVNEAVLAMSLDMLASGYKRKLQNQAALGKDVSGMAGVYYQIVNESNRIKKKIGIDNGASTGNTSQSIRYGKSFSNILNTASSITTTATSWQEGLNKSSDVFKPTTNIGGSRLPANFFQK